MARYLTGTLPKHYEAAIEALAQEDAAEAIRQGATAPWGDGETLPDVADVIRSLPVTLARRLSDGDAKDGGPVSLAYDHFFRAAIDREAPSAEEAIRQEELADRHSEGAP